MNKYGFNGSGMSYILEFQIGIAIPNAGVPVISSGTTLAGVVLPTVTVGADSVGLALDSQATLVTAQQTDNSDPARRVSVIVNADLIMKAKLSGSSTESVALTLLAVTTASADGLDVTTGSAWDSPTYLDGTLWGYDGANVGIERKIAVVSSTAADPAIALPQDTVVGDNFLRVNLAPGTRQYADLTALFTEVDTSVAVDTGNDNMVAIGLILNDIGNDGRNNSYALLMSADSLYGGATFG